MDPDPDEGVGGVVGRQVGQPVADGVLRVAILEVGQEDVRRRVGGDVRDRLPEQPVENGRRHRLGRGPRVDAEVDPPALLPLLLPLPPLDQDLCPRQEVVRDDQRVAVSGLDGGVPPADLPDTADVDVEPDHVARLDGAVDLERHAGHHVGEGLLEGEADHRRDDGGGGDEAGDVDLVDREEVEDETQVGESDGEVADDLRRPDPDEPQEGEEEDRGQVDEGDPLEEKGEEPECPGGPGHRRQQEERRPRPERQGGDVEGQEVEGGTALPPQEEDHDEGQTAEDEALAEHLGREQGVRVGLDHFRSGGER